LTDDREEASGSIVPGIGDGLTKPSLGLIRRGLQELSNLRDNQRHALKPAKRARVMLVDDREALLQSLGNVLTGAGYEVQSTLNALEAIEIARQFQPEVALLGCTKPVMDEIRLGVELSTFLHHTKIVLWNEVDRSEHLEELVVQGYRFALLPWPCEKEELLECIQSCVLQATGEDLVTGFLLEAFFKFIIDDSAACKNTFSIIFFDVLEHWHEENVTASPREREKLLAELARGVNKICRPIHLRFRYGENRFALLLLEESSDFTEEMKNKLNELIHKTDWREVTGCCVSLTAKFAVVSFPEDDRRTDELIGRAMETLSDNAATP
jgi:PleD family two-component response regulator